MAAHTPAGSTPAWLGGVSIALAATALVFTFWLLKPEEPDRLKERRLRPLKYVRLAGFLALTFSQAAVLALRFAAGTLFFGDNVYDAQLAAPLILWATVVVRATAGWGGAGAASDPCAAGMFQCMRSGRRLRPRCRRRGPQVVLAIVWQRQASAFMLPIMGLSGASCGMLLLLNCLHDFNDGFTRADRVIGWVAGGLRGGRPCRVARATACVIHSAPRILALHPLDLSRSRTGVTTCSVRPAPVDGSWLCTACLCVLPAAG